MDLENILVSSGTGIFSPKCFFLSVSKLFIKFTKKGKINNRVK